DDAQRIAARGQQLGMRDVRTIVSGMGWGGNQREHRGRPMRIRSTAAASELPDSEVAVSRDAAASIGLTKGDDITVIVPRTRLTPFGPVPVFRTYRIAQLLPPVTDERSPEVALNINETEHLFGTNGPTSIEMYGDSERADAIQSALARDFPNVQVKTWKEINRPLFLALRLEKIVMFVTISLIIFVAALNLISSLSMLIMEKRPAVGVLRTLGATDRSILTIFLAVGLLIGLTGTLLGDLFGLGVALSANKWHLVPLPSDIYFIRYLPFAVDRSDVLGVNAVAVLLSVLATWYPARMAAKLDPIAAIKDEA
ncbi:MAG TPA: FtsX-like permease family protein, partial [Thermoanaerobaculia bacterium]|nr:FtsX-like permease family protein [Thermoanaerobaculia bacterium]